MTRQQLAQAEMPAAEKAAYGKQLDEGWALHMRGREADDRKLMRQSVDILDAIKAKLAK